MDTYLYLESRLNLGVLECSRRISYCWRTADSTETDVSEHILDFLSPDVTTVVSKVTDPPLSGGHLPLTHVIGAEHELLTSFYLCHVSPSQQLFL